MTTNEQIRKWTGPALFSYGFRPFFLFGAIWAATTMVLWIVMLSGVLSLPTRLDPVTWHAHEFLFGYLGAIIAGFLLTAVPNWTGRLPVVGWPLALLFGVWISGRIAITFSAMIPAPLSVVIDLSFTLLLGAMILREIIAGKNWRNLVVLALLAVFTLANLIFHIEAAHGDFAAQGYGLRLGVGTVIMLIALIGGRVVPSFTRNWMVAAAKEGLPTPPMQRFDKATMIVSVFALILWVVLPQAQITGAALVVTGTLHLQRLVRWQGHRTLAEPLLWVLHLGYVFVPLGALLEGAAILRPDLLALGAAQHLWMAGGFAMMTLAVMARSTLGHTGQVLTAGRGSVAMFMCVLASVVLRIAAGIWPEVADILYALSALFWTSAFAGFIALYGASLLRPKPDRIL
jgi:uncharacterized protein involved in response to NO